MMIENIRQRVGARIRAAREQKGLTAAEVGERIGLSYGQDWKYEIGESLVSVVKLTEIARALSVPVTFFFDEIPPPHVPRSNGRAALLLAAYDKFNPDSRAPLVLIAKSLAETGRKHLLAAE
jgi:transcriptional regulator with XRE-family HTH domain